MLRPWEDLPDFLKKPEVRPYWEILYRKRNQLIIKRVFDVILSSALIVVLAIPMVILAIIIKIDSKGPVFFRQERVTAYGKLYRIHKFRTMVSNADENGARVTVYCDERITKIGRKIRPTRLDELPQVFDVFLGDMSFVGTRPETVWFVEKYKPEYLATLLIPAGITSEAAIRFKGEEKLLSSATDVNAVYLNQVIPCKMRWNLMSIKKFSLVGDLATMVRTILAVFGKEYR